jgi:hypothetical protein
MGIDSDPDAQGTLVDHVLIDGSSTPASDDFRGLRLSLAQPRSDDPVGFPSQVFKKWSQAVISCCLTSALRGGE